ncbi:single-stranded DNA-binding protein, partial [Gallibacterium anatis]|uniref:single-stranded DNA-binding protein n=1 Tax=Gallibacterium anatis TaxID=750 RepID=UPI00057ED90B
VYHYTSDVRNDKISQEKQEIVEWHKIVLGAEVAQQYLHKGTKVYIEGKIRTPKWKDNQNQEHSVTEILANTLEILSRKNENDFVTSDSRQPKNVYQNIPPIDDTSF